jgi:hypothetical protein
MEQTPTHGYQSSMSHKLHFGLADNEIVDSIRVEWPRGNISRLKNIKANQLISITEDGVKQNLLPLPQSKKYFHRQNHPLTMNTMNMDRMIFSVNP